jgi:hypothetical protein
LGGELQRRGAHVSTPERGSRGACLYFGGILGSHADLRREMRWGNLGLAFFWVLLGDPRGGNEGGGQLVLSRVCLGEFIVLIGVWKGHSPVIGVTICSKGND